MSNRISPFGDGLASARIVDILLRDVTGYPVRDAAVPMFDTVQ